MDLGRGSRSHQQAQQTTCTCGREGHVPQTELPSPPLLGWIPHDSGRGHANAQEKAGASGGVEQRRGGRGRESGGNEEKGQGRWSHWGGRKLETRHATVAIPFINLAGCCGSCCAAGHAATIAGVERVHACRRPFVRPDAVAGVHRKAERRQRAGGTRRPGVAQARRRNNGSKAPHDVQRTVIHGAGPATRRTRTNQIQRPAWAEGTSGLRTMACGSAGGRGSAVGQQDVVGGACSL